MEARALGRTGLRVSALGLGAGRMGDADLDQAAVDRLVGRALDLGVALFDTARSYGASEERLGRALGGRRDAAVLSTKVGYGVAGVPDWTGESIRRGLDEALAKLRTDRVDLLHLHSCPPEVLAREDVGAAVREAVASGKARIAAYSGDGPGLDAALASGLFGAVQCSVSACDQAALEGPVPRAAAAGVGVLAKRPLANAPWRHAARPAREDEAESWERFRALGLDPSGLAWDELFLRFAAHAPGVAAALVGTASEEHLARAARAAALGPLAPEQAAAIRAAFRRVGAGWPGRI